MSSNNTKDTTPQDPPQETQLIAEQVRNDITQPSSKTLEFGTHNEPSQNPELPDTTLEEIPKIKSSNPPPPEFSNNTPDKTIPLGLQTPIPDTLNPKENSINPKKTVALQPNKPIPPDKTDPDLDLSSSSETPQQDEPTHDNPPPQKQNAPLLGKFPKKTQSFENTTHTLQGHDDKEKNTQKPFEKAGAFYLRGQHPDRQNDHTMQLQPDEIDLESTQESDVPTKEQIIFYAKALLTEEQFSKLSGESPSTPPTSDTPIPDTPLETPPPDTSPSSGPQKGFEPRLVLLVLLAAVLASIFLYLLLKG